MRPSLPGRPNDAPAAPNPAHHRPSGRCPLRPGPTCAGSMQASQQCFVPLRPRSPRLGPSFGD
eukprot:9654368-Lingulodinium_polyedra.AAC.1